MVAERDEVSLLDTAFKVLFRTDADCMLKKEQLRKIFTMQNRVQLFGLDEAAFDLLIEELSPHADESSGVWRVPLSALQSLRGFQPGAGELPPSGRHERMTGRSRDAN